MNKIFISILFILLAFTQINAQVIFHKTYGGTGDDKANCVRRTQDGGYIIVGSTNSFGAGGLDVYVIRTDKYGDTVWSRTFGGIYDDIGYAVNANNDGSFIIVGTTFSFGAGQQDIYVIKINGIGDTLWTRTYGGNNLESGNDIKQTTDGGFVIVGSTNSFGAGNSDVYIIKINALGDTTWTRTYGGTLDEVGNSIQQNGAGGYVIIGSTTSFGAGNNDIYFITTDNLGNIVNTNITYGSINGNEYGNCGKQTIDGGYILCGSTSFYGAGFNDGYVLKTDVNGTIQYQRAFGNTSYDKIIDIQQTADLGFIAIGTTQSFGGGNSYIYLLKTDATLVLNWSKYIGGLSLNEGNSVLQAGDGGFILAGSTQSFGQGGWDIYLIKTDGNGYSGCFGFPASTIATDASSLNTHPNPLISFGCYAKYDSTIINHGGKDSTICFMWEGINELSKNDPQINIFPNPASLETNIVISTSNMDNNSLILKVFNVLGKEIAINYRINKVSSDISSFVIETKNLCQGVYFLRTLIGDKIYNNKIIVK